MSDKQKASPAQVNALAEALDVPPDLLENKPESPVFHSKNQKGGYANNYFVQNGIEALVKAKDETIETQKKIINYLKELVRERERK